MDEHGPAFGVRAGGAGRRVGDEQDQFAGTALAEAAAQRIAALGPACGASRLPASPTPAALIWRSTNNSGVNATIIPSAIFIALFACIATLRWPSADSGVTAAVTISGITSDPGAHTSSAITAWPP